VSGLQPLDAPGIPGAADAVTAVRPGLVALRRTRCPAKLKKQVKNIFGATAAPHPGEPAKFVFRDVCMQACKAPFGVHFRPGQTCITPLGQIHNVYLPGSAVIHTVKVGVRGSIPRWEPEPSFDPQTHCLSETDLLALASSDSD
jgi:hypothetical protein